jgi:hypothetical protein
MADMEIAFDPDPLVIAGKLAEFEAALVPLLLAAGEKSGTVFKQVAINNMHFKHSTGQFEDSLEVVQHGPYETSIGSNLPYGNRLEWGFYGTDSLGRHYNRAGLHFMMMTLYGSTVTAQTALDYMTAVETAWNMVVSGIPLGAIAVMGNA